MRIHDLRIDGFGRFANLELGPFDRPVTVFHGPNEAGKTTLLEFIRRVLFGFPDGRSRLNPYPPLAGGRHGGRITILSDGGEVVTVDRSQGGRGGVVTLTTESGEPLPSHNLPRLLGHHSRDVFQRIFAFAIDELHDDALLSDESVNSQIYSAGIGAARLPDALKRLSDEKGGLFLKGGRRHALYDVAQNLERVDSSLQEVADNASDYGRLSTRLKDVEAELGRQNKRRQECQSQLYHQEQLKRAWDDWIDLVTTDEQLAELTVIDDFPSDGVKRLETLVETIRNARREHAAARRDVNDAESAAKTPIEHEAILERSAEIRRLERRREYFDSAVRSLPEVSTELSSFRRELARTFADLGPDWDESRLESFDCSIAVRQEVSQHQKQLSRFTTEFEGKNVALDQADYALKEATEAETDAEQRLDAATEPSLDDEQIRQRRSLIRVGHSQLDRARSTGKRAGDLRTQLDGLISTSTPVRETNRSKTVAAVGVAFAVALFVGGAVLGGPALPVGIVAGLVAVVLAAYVFATNQSPAGADPESPLAAPIEKSLRDAETEQIELEAKLDEYAESLGLDAIDEHSLIAANESLDREQQRLDQWDRRSEELTDAKRQTEQKTNRAKHCRRAVEAARKAIEVAEVAWRHWLSKRDLRTTLSPDGVLEIRSKVELGHTQLRNVRGAQQRIDTIQNRINGYKATIEPLASDFGVEFDVDNDRGVATAADMLVERCADVEREVAKRNEAQTSLTKAKRSLEDRQHDLRSANQKMERLHRSGGATDAEDFRKRAKIHSQWRDLERKRSEAIGHLQRLSGPGERLQALQSELRETDVEEIAEAIRRAEEERDAVDKEIGELNFDLGATRTDRENLASEEESSRLRAKQHRLLEKMRGHARNWTVLTIAENLLKEAQSKFELERQPAVVRHSEEFFRDITGARYYKVFSPLGKSEIHVTDSAGVPKQPNQLSRGTREQLFLSLRFGLIRELGQRSETLPVVIDEALVNCDPDRGIKAASAFMDLSRTNQVLVFTCHPQIVEWFVMAAAESGVQEPQVVEIT